MKGTAGWAGGWQGARFSPTHDPLAHHHHGLPCSLLPGFPRDKPKLSPRQWDARDQGRLLLRPQSAGSSLSQPGKHPTGAPAGRGHPAASRRVGVSRGLHLQPGRVGWGSGVWVGLGGAEAGWRVGTGRWGNRSPCWSRSEVGGSGPGQCVKPVCFRVGTGPRFWVSLAGQVPLLPAPSCNPCPSPPGTAASMEHRPASSHGHLSQAPGLFPPLQPPRDGSSTPAPGQGWGSPQPQLPSRRASSSGQQQ